MQKKSIVTGGAGFIGSHLVDKLLSLDHKVLVIDNFSSGKEEYLSDQKNNPNLVIHKKDICDKDIQPLFGNVDNVFHVAAVPRVQYSIDNIEDAHNSNVNGTLNVLECSKKAGVKRFIFSASSSAYGDQEQLPLTEDMHVSPMSPYALHKVTGEFYCNLYHLLYGLETVSLRYFNVFGPRLDPSGSYAMLIPRSIDRVLKNKGPLIFGDGEQTRDFTYITDVVNANILASETTNKEAFGNIFNIGGGRNLSVNEVTKLIIGDSGITPEMKPPVIEPKHTLADISKAKRILNWNPQVKFELGISETVDWYKSNQ